MTDPERAKMDWWATHLYQHYPMSLEKAETLAKDIISAIEAAIAGAIERCIEGVKYVRDKGDWHQGTGVIEVLDDVTLELRALLNPPSQPTAECSCNKGNSFKLVTNHFEGCPSLKPPAEKREECEHRDKHYAVECSKCFKILR